MLRLTLLLCAAMIGALMILGEDRGQMRPGLARSGAEGPAPAVKPAEEAAPVQIAASPIDASPQAAPAAVEAPVAIAAPAPPEPATPAPYVEPQREVVIAVEEPIFSLSALGNELVPGEDGATDGPVVTETATAETDDGTIWYVNASSVNVRAEPSTEAEVLGRLGSGEAALLVAAVDDDWARIVIQGDGMEGYVALRYLSPAAP